MESPKDVAKFVDLLERQRIFEFLVGLNPKLDQVRSRILGKFPIPSLNEVCSLVRNEESKIDAIMKTPYHDNSTLNVAMENNSNTNKGGEKDTRWCDYCKRPKHTRKTCWKLNGRPQQGNKNGKFSKPSKSFQAETVSGPASAANTVSTNENLPFTKEQLDLLNKIIGKTKVTPTSTSCAFAQSSTLHKALTTTSVSNSNSWIIDSRASDQMTKEPNFFLSYIRCSSKQKVQVVDGTFNPIIGKENVSFAKDYPHFGTARSKNVL